MREALSSKISILGGTRCWMHAGGFHDGVAGWSRTSDNNWHSLSVEMAQIAEARYSAQTCLTVLRRLMLDGSACPTADDKMGFHLAVLECLK